MQLLASQPTSIAKILDISIKLYKASFTKLIGFFLIMAVFIITSGLILEPLIAVQQTNPAIPPSIEHLGALLAYVFIVSLVSFVFYAAMLYRIDNIAKQRQDSFIEALLMGLKKFPSILWAVFLYMLALTGGMLLLVVPGIILSLSMAFYLYFIVIDSLGGYASLKASHNLVWGHWWRTMTVFMAPGIVILVIFVTLGALLAFLGSDVNSPLFNAATNLISAFVTPYFFALGYVQFHDLKLRKSGNDLEARLAK